MALDLRSLYVALNEMTTCPRLLFLEVKDDFFREDCSIKFRDVWKGQFPQGVFHTCSAAELMSRKEDLGASLFALKSLWSISEIALRGKKNDEFLSLIKEFSDPRAPDDNYFCFVSSEPPSKSFLELLKEQGVLLALEPIKPWERPQIIEGWIALFIKKLGGKISKQAIISLAQGFAQDRSALVQELDKLLLFAGKEVEIQLADVESLCLIETKTSSWNLLEGVLNQDVKMITQALTYLEEWNEIALLRFMRGQIEKFLLAENSAAFRTKTQQKQYEQAQRLGATRLLSWIKALEMEEVAIKSGESQGSFEELLLLFISFTKG